MCGGEREEQEDEGDLDEGKEPLLALAADGPVAMAEGSDEGHAPGKEPDEVQEPEPESRDGVVVAGIAGGEEAEEVLVGGVKPEEAVILAGAAGHRSCEGRRAAGVWGRGARGGVR